MMLSIAVIILGVVLWYLISVVRADVLTGIESLERIMLTNSERPPTTSSGDAPMNATALQVIGRIRSGIFAEGARDCTPTSPPCDAWRRELPAVGSAPNRTTGFKDAVEGLLSGIASPGYLLFVIEGAHDSQSLTRSAEVQVGSNFNLAMLRAYHARTELEQFLHGKGYDATYISTVRANTPRAGVVSDDRVVSITLLAAVPPRG